MDYYLTDKTQTHVVLLFGWRIKKVGRNSRESSQLHQKYPHRESICQHKKLKGALEPGSIVTMPDQMTPIERAILSLDGLSVGDALGATFGEGVSFERSKEEVADRVLPDKPWQWTDDTHMALSVVEVLAAYDEIRQNELAKLFAERFIEEPYRGYAPGTAWILEEIRAGGNWRSLARQVFDGGSYGNGAAMRTAPIGGYFAGQPAKAAAEARKSALITHAHPERQAGAIAVAVAAAIAAGNRNSNGKQFLEKVLAYIPSGETHDRIQRAIQIPPNAFEQAVNELGTGWEVTASDTVPFCLWCASNNLASYEDAIWKTLAGGGDRDTTSAIVGGIVALSVGEVPDEWLDRRECLPDDFAL